MKTDRCVLRSPLQSLFFDACIRPAFECWEYSRKTITYIMRYSGEQRTGLVEGPVDRFLPELLKDRVALREVLALEEAL